MSEVAILVLVLIAIHFIFVRRLKPSTIATPADTMHPVNPIREILFGDMPQEGWQGDGVTPPWSHFKAASDHLQAARSEEAIAELRAVLAMPDLESRQYLQAWSALRSLGVDPPAEQARTVLGVVVEVGMPKGHDYLAAYADHHARYFNFSGAGVIWERPNASMDQPIDQLLASAAITVQKIGPWTEPRPGPPPDGQVRLNFLTPSGLFFGQARARDFETDPMGKDVMANATTLMLKLMDLSRNRPK